MKADPKDVKTAKKAVKAISPALSKKGKAALNRAIDKAAKGTSPASRG